jgi:hypothetical protein
MVINYEIMLAWLLIGLFSAWSGIVSYLKAKQNKRKKTISVVTYLISSGFFGILGGLLAFEAQMSYYLTLVASGVFGILGYQMVPYFLRWLSEYVNRKRPY